MAENTVYQSFFNRSILKLELRLKSVEKTQVKLGATLEQTNTALASWKGFQGNMAAGPVGHVTPKNPQENPATPITPITPINITNPATRFESKRIADTKISGKKTSDKNNQKKALRKPKKIEQNDTSSGGLDKLWKQSLAVKQTFDDAYSSGTKGIEQAQASANTFSQAWKGVSTNLQQGKGFFSTIQQASPLIGKGLSQAQQSFSILGSSLAKTKEGIGQAGNALDAWKSLFSTKLQPEENSRNGNKNNKNHKTKNKKKSNRSRDNNQDSSAVKIGAIWQQGLQLKDSVTATYESGAKGIDQAQAAAGTFQNAWQQASQDVQQGKGFFTVLSNTAPLIGEGFNQAKESYTTLNSTVSQAKESFTQLQTIRDNISSFFSGAPEEENSSHTQRENRGKKNKKGNKSKKSTSRRTQLPRASAGKKLGRLKSVGFKGLGNLSKASGGVLRLGSSLASLARGVIPAVISGMRVLGAVFLTNPIGLAITGIALAAGLIIRYWEPIKTFFSGIWGSVKPIFTTAWTWIKAIFNFSPIGLLINNWSKIGSFFSNIWSSIKSIFGAGISWIMDKVLAPFNAVKKIFSSIGKFFGMGDNASAEDEKSEEQAVEQISDQKTKKSHKKDKYKDDQKIAKFVKPGNVVDFSMAKQKRPAMQKRKLVPAIALGTALAAAPLAAKTTLETTAVKHAAYTTPLQTASNATATQTTKNIQYHINVNASPGMDEQKLARLIREQLEVHEQQQALDSDRQLFD